MADFKTGSVRANGLDFHFLEMGEGPLALCLHGFPDHAYSFRHLLPDLADAGFRAVAPFMRGYAPTEAPKDGCYQSVLLAKDVLALITALGSQRAYLVGNDWGAGAVTGCYGPLLLGTRDRMSAPTPRIQLADAPAGLLSLVSDDAARFYNGSADDIACRWRPAATGRWHDLTLAPGSETTAPLS